MVSLRLQNNILLVEDCSKEIFQWDHRLYFVTTSGYEFDEINVCYSFSNEDELYETLKDTLNYLQEKKIKFTTDEKVAHLIQKIETNQKEFEKAVIVGEEIKNKNQITDYKTSIIRDLMIYQKQGLEHLLGIKNGANFSVPGSGKTTVIYAAFDILRNTGTVDKLLVIGPRSCFLPWEEESKACFGHFLRSVRLTGTKKIRYSSYLQSDKFDLFLCTYQTATNDIKEIISLCKKHKFFVVVDESHNIKRMQGGIWAEAILKIAPYATQRAILTGTPMPNNYTDLWTQITFLWPGSQVLGNRNYFRSLCESENGGATVHQIIKPLFFRVPKSKLGLPPVKFKVHKCKLEPYQSTIYQMLAVKFLKELNITPEEVRFLRQWRKAKMVRLIQAASNPTLLTRYSEEFDVLPFKGLRENIIELIQEYPKFEIPTKFKTAIKLVHDLLGNREKVIVWTIFVHNINMLSHLLKEVRPFKVYGAVPRDASENIEFNREQQLREFKEIKGPAVLLANPAACAESVSLHKICKHAIYLDRSFNCGQFMQSLDRIHRIGLDSNEIVTYHILLADNTIDDTIHKRLKEKKDRMEHLLGKDLPVGTFEVDDQLMEQFEDQEAIDFKETLRDLKEVYSSFLKRS